MMFERFARELRDLVKDVVGDLGPNGVAGAADFARVLLARDSGTAASLFTRCGVDRAAVLDALTAASRRGGLSDADAEALAGLGIDLDAVVAAVEQSHGAAALSPPAKPRGRFGTRIDDGGRALLERSLKEAVELGDRRIGEEHMLLAMLTLPGPVRDALADGGLTHADVRRQLAAAS